MRPTTIIPFSPLFKPPPHCPEKCSETLPVYRFASRFLIRLFVAFFFPATGGGIFALVTVLRFPTTLLSPLRGGDYRDRSLFGLPVVLLSVAAATATFSRSIEWSAPIASTFVSFSSTVSVWQYDGRSEKTSNHENGVGNDRAQSAGRS